MVLPNKVDRRTNLANEYLEAFDEDYADAIAPAHVPVSQDNSQRRRRRPNGLRTRGTVHDRRTRTRGIRPNATALQRRLDGSA